MKKNKKLTRAILIFISIIFILISFMMLHLTPSLAIRTHLLFTGHPIAPFIVNFKINEFQDSLDRDSLEIENARIYQITTKDINFLRTGNPITNMKVKRVRFLYFADYYGQA